MARRPHFTSGAVESTTADKTSNIHAALEALARLPLNALPDLRARVYSTISENDLTDIGPLGGPNAARKPARDRCGFPLFSELALKGEGKDAAARALRRKLLWNLPTQLACNNPGYQTFTWRFRGHEGAGEALNTPSTRRRPRSTPRVRSTPAAEDDDADGVHQGRKRRKISKSASCSVRSTAASCRSSRSSRQRRSTTHAAQLPSAIRTSGRDIDSPTPSRAIPAPSEANMFLARFEEWPLEDVVLKRITEDGKTTFELQFDWDSDLCQPHAGRSVSNPMKRRRLSKTLPSVAKSSGARWTSEEDETVRRMKQNGDSWAVIQRALPHRSEGTIQVRYSTKLRG
ncbi:hypothetical protein MRS44_003861 [Fusarium solani]|uniref:uncharacterized protein n=1 Tax=Fusarium solani TaxID=169388 RepID=UPI0032C420E9|nr:hypothetical protein MRS44_003861 [Fusarium solani]